MAVAMPCRISAAGIDTLFIADMDTAAIGPAVAGEADITVATTIIAAPFSWCSASVPPTALTAHMAPSACSDLYADMAMRDKRVAMSAWMEINAF